jgi:hypothetical protein
LLGFAAKQRAVPGTVPLSQKEKSGADPKTRMMAIHCGHKTTNENVAFLFITNCLQLFAVSLEITCDYGE